MTLAVYGIACLLFGTALLRQSVFQHAQQEFRRLACAIAVLRAPDMSDAEKEARTRAAALESCSGALRLFARLAVAAAAALLPVMVADCARLLPAADVWRFALRGDVILGTTAVAAAVLLAGKGLPGRRA